MSKCKLMSMKKVSQTISLDPSCIEQVKNLFKHFGYYIDLVETRDIFATYLYTQLEDGEVIKEVWVEILPNWRNNNYNFNIVYEKYRR